MLIEIFSGSTSGTVPARASDTNSMNSAHCQSAKHSFHWRVRYSMQVGDTMPTGPRGEKRPADVTGNAVKVMRIAKRVQVDEIWSFTAAKQKNVAWMKKPVDGASDTRTWTAIEAQTKLIISHFVGGRDGDCAAWFVQDVADRLANRVQLTSDGHKAYLEAVEGAFGADIDYAMLNKIYGASSESAKGRYSPAECIGVTKQRIEGKPDPKHVSTSYVERSNLTQRMHNRRFTRLTNGFSKKFENHAYSVALFAMYYNFVKIHLTLKETPAMAAGVSKTLWEIGDIVKLVEAIEAKPAKRGPYKKREA